MTTQTNSNVVFDGKQPPQIIPDKKQLSQMIKNSPRPKPMENTGFSHQNAEFLRNLSELRRTLNEVHSLLSETPTKETEGACSSLLNRISAINLPPEIKLKEAAGISLQLREHVSKTLKENGAQAHLQHDLEVRANSQYDMQQRIKVENLTKEQLFDRMESFESSMEEFSKQYNESVQSFLLAPLTAESMRKFQESGLTYRKKITLETKTVVENMHKNLPGMSNEELLKSNRFVQEQITVLNTRIKRQNEQIQKWNAQKEQATDPHEVQKYSCLCEDGRKNIETLHQCRGSFNGLERNIQVIQKDRGIRIAGQDNNNQVSEQPDNNILRRERLGKSSENRNEEKSHPKSLATLANFASRYNILGEKTSFENQNEEGSPQKGLATLVNSASKYNGSKESVPQPTREQYLTA